MTDEELRSELQPVWNDLAGSTASILGASETAEAPDKPPATDVTASETGETDDTVSPDVHDLLVDIVQRPFQSVTARYNLFSSSGKAFNVKQTALEQGLVREKWIHDGSKFKVLELTQQGREYLREEDIAVRHKGRGGIIHRYWQEQICTAFTDAGYEAAIEEEEADIAVRLRDRRIAIEIATRAADREIEHVQDRLTGGFDAVWIACRNGGVRSQLEEMLEDAELDDERRVRLLLFQETIDVDALLS